jgi:hypothetical protein
MGRNFVPKAFKKKSVDALNTVSSLVHAGLAASMVPRNGRSLWRGVAAILFPYSSKKSKSWANFVRMQQLGKVTAGQSSCSGDTSFPESVLSMFQEFEYCANT